MSLEGEARRRRGEPRVPFEAAVRLRYRLFHEFLEENAANLSPGGMFIRTVHPTEPGSELVFEIRLEDGDEEEFTLIQGRGEVVWVRHPGQEPDAEPGMGIRFVELEGDSQSLVKKIVSERVKAGLELFDLESHAPAAEPEAAVEPEVAPEPEAAAEPELVADSEAVREPEVASEPETGSEGRPLVAAPAGAEDRPIWELESGGGAAAPPQITEQESAEKEPAERLAAEPPAQAEATPAPVNPLPDAPPAAVLEPPAPGTATAPAPPAGRTGARRTSPVRLVAVAVISALVGAAAVLTFYWLYVQPSIVALETRIDELAGSPGGPWQPPEVEPERPLAEAPTLPTAAEEAAGPVAGVPAPEVEAAAEPLARADPSAEVADALRSWAAAWSDQRVDDYLAFYASEFEPPDGLDRAAWAASRRARIERPQWIRVALTLVQVESLGPDRAMVGFVQSYRSERYKDLVRKRLVMVREAGAWKIAAERSS